MYSYCRPNQREVFDAMDSDGDGALTLEEVQAFRRLNPASPGSATAEELFKLADADGDGTISFEEFIKSPAQFWQEGECCAALVCACGDCSILFKIPRNTQLNPTSYETTRAF
jgi:hypothetical protein